MHTQLIENASAISKYFKSEKKTLVQCNITVDHLVLGNETQCMVLDF